MVTTSIKRLETSLRPASNSESWKKSKKSDMSPTKAAVCAMRQFESKQEEIAKAKETLPLDNSVLMPKKSPKSLNSTTIKMGSSTYN